MNESMSVFLGKQEKAGSEHESEEVGSFQIYINIVIVNIVKYQHCQISTLSLSTSRLDLFTPGVVASFPHQENLQNLTYYQSTYVDGDALQICDGDDDESEE